MTNTFDRHTIHRYDEELHALHFQVMEMGELVLNQLCLVMESLHNMDLPLAQGIIDRERIVNEMEVSADTVVCSILVKRCPKGTDLRTVLAASRIVNNLERIGDETVKLANFVVYSYSNGQGDENNLPLELFKLGASSIDIMQSALEVFERLDAVQARQTEELHLNLGREFQRGLHNLMDLLQSQKISVADAVSQVLMMKALERIGEHAQRIAESVIFQLEGEETPHKLSEIGQGLPLF